MSLVWGQSSQLKKGLFISYIANIQSNSWNFYSLKEAIEGVHTSKFHSMMCGPVLTHWSRDKMTATFQTTFWKWIFSNQNLRISIKIWLKFVGAQLTINAIVLCLATLHWATGRECMNVTHTILQIALHKKSIFYINYENMTMVLVICHHLNECPKGPSLPYHYDELQISFHYCIDFMSTDLKHFPKIINQMYKKCTIQQNHDKKIQPFFLKKYEHFQKM